MKRNFISDPDPPGKPEWYAWSLRPRQKGKEIGPCEWENMQIHTKLTRTLPLQSPTHESRSSTTGTVQLPWNQHYEREQNKIVQERSQLSCQGHQQIVSHA